MYEFQGGIYVWVCARNKEEAINLYIEVFGDDSWYMGVDIYGDEAIRKMSGDEVFTYHEDDYTVVKDTIANHIKNYCKEPDLFAVSEFNYLDT